MNQNLVSKSNLRESYSKAQKVAPEPQFHEISEVEQLFSNF